MAELSVSLRSPSSSIGTRQLGLRIGRLHMRAGHQVDEFFIHGDVVLGCKQPNRPAGHGNRMHIELHGSPPPYCFRQKIKAYEDSTLNHTPARLVCSVAGDGGSAPLLLQSLSTSSSHH